MKIHSTQPKPGTVQFDISVAKQYHQVYFTHLEHGELKPSSESQLLCGLLPSMSTKQKRLEINTGLPHSFLQNQRKAQDFLQDWYPKLSIVSVQVNDDYQAPHIGQRIATFFSGGVDSFYTLIKNRESITDIIFVHGFDIPLNQSELRETTSKRLKEVAKDFNIRLIEVETNLRDYMDQHVNWTIAHGSALALVGHLLSDQFPKIFIPASVSEDELAGHGSHPDLDPLWGNDTLEFKHDGVESTRVQKVKTIATNETALKHLRVCYLNEDGLYNCGRCEKCLRTMVSLQAFQSLKKCATLPDRICLDSIEQVYGDDFSKYYVQENLRALEDLNVEIELQNSLKKVLQQPRKLKTLEYKAKTSARKMLRKIKLYR